MGRTKASQIIDALCEYRHIEPQFAMVDFGQWALETGAIQLGRDAAVRAVAIDAQKAAQKELYITEDGCKVRMFWSARMRVVGADGKPRKVNLWTHVEDMDQGFARISLVQRFRASFADAARVLSDYDDLRTFIMPDLDPIPFEEIYAQHGRQLFGGEDND